MSEVHKGERMYQQVTVVGRLGRDPELKYTPEGVPVASFSVACDRKRGGADGEQVDETLWVQVSAWRRLAETCSQYLHKGSAVLVVGELKPDPQTGGPRVWTGRDGQPRASFEVTAGVVRFLPGGGDGASAEQAQPEQDEIPF